MQPRQQPMPSKTKSWSIKLVHVHREFKNYISLFISVISLILFCKQLYLFQLEKWHFAHYYFFLIEFQFPYKALLFPKKKKNRDKNDVDRSRIYALNLQQCLMCVHIVLSAFYLFIFFIILLYLYNAHIDPYSLKLGMIILPIDTNIVYCLRA